MTTPDEDRRALAALGVVPAEILLPAPGIDLFKWAVIACDQYTTDVEYWQKVAWVVGEAPSSLHLVLPEVYLGAADEEERIARIHRTMRDYLRRGILRPVGTGLVYLERRTAFGRLRRGVLAAVDLERYDYRPGARPPIRATEATVVDRLPPRVRIRRGAVLEVPHAMLLLDDRRRRTIEPLVALGQTKRPLYETSLMMGGGEIRGFMLNEAEALSVLRNGLEALAASGGEDSFLLAVGDGNHSLAAAKVVWEERKTAGAPITHPARYTLVEIINLYDEGLVLGPIHRAVHGMGGEELLRALETFFAGRGSGVEIRYVRDRGEAGVIRLQLAEERPGAQFFEFISGEVGGVVSITSPPHLLTVGTLQMFLDELEAQGRVRVDYIHGEEAVAALARRPGWVGFFLPAMAKEELFPTVRKHGMLPKKSFSLGEAEEKRFYLECRRIAEV
ncbi:MAG: DUF1015 domain-containing protein [Firmicutes bacterium]|nr:DUF1015 domain-containing protein [Bacillota bacterium]